MIDIHTHIMPAVDDGSPAEDISLKHLGMMAAAGVTDVVLTPHFIRAGYRPPHTDRLAKQAALQKGCQAAGLSLTLHPGAEVYLDSKSLQEINEHKLNINQTSYVLVETAMSTFPSDLYEILYQLVKAGYRPILAHPERYQTVISDPELARDFMHRNVYLQINAGSLLGHYGKRSQQAAWYLLEHGYAHFLASDNHCHRDDYPLAKGCELITRRIDDHLPRMLTEINPRKMLNNEPIPYFYLEQTSGGSENFFQRFFRRGKS